ncbi:hypothetical protein [Streptomyces sp. NPDC054787]
MSERLDPSGPAGTHPIERSIGIKRATVISVRSDIRAGLRSA